MKALEGLQIEWRVCGYPQEMFLVFRGGWIWNWSDGRKGMVSYGFVRDGADSEG